MDKLDDNHFRCNCGSHAVVVSRYEDYPEIEVDFWLAGSESLGWRNLFKRIRDCWTLLRTGNVFIHGVFLKPGQAEKMGETLLRLARKEKVG